MATKTAASKKTAAKKTAAKKAPAKKTKPVPNDDGGKGGADIVRQRQTS